ncbi:MAG TPA: CAP domain-containing protein, partial [Ilumatobacteraceae bacterium]
NDWLGIVNTYRAMSGLGAVSENGTWSSQAYSHGCYMLYNGISHDEIPGKLGYTAGGDLAGNNGNVAVSSSTTATARNHVDLWMTGPFHAIGVLRHNLVTTGFGMCVSDATSPWKSGATLDVLRGLDSSRPRPSTPIVFPGRDATVPLSRFVTEAPNPMALCGWSGEAGLPLIAMMPSAVTSASATLTGPNGAIPTCSLHGGNTGSDATAQSILRSENAVIVMPRTALTPGRYTATVSTNAGSTSWSFNVDPSAPLSATPAPFVPAPIPDATPATAASKFDPITPERWADSRMQFRSLRLRAREPRQIVMAGPDVTAVSANFTIDRPAGPGYLTVYNCSESVPNASTLNFVNRAVPNQAVIPLKAGTLCLYSETDTDIIIDVNGYFRPSGGNGFVAMDPSRVYDSRVPGSARLWPGEVRAIKVEDVPGGVPSSATAVAVNLTVASGETPGYLSAFPCGGNTSVSNVNFVTHEARPNSAIVRTAADGTICVASDTLVHVLVDVSGYFVAGNGLAYTPLTPTRLLDTRAGWGQLNPATGGAQVGGGQIVKFKVAGERGVPADAKAVSINLTAVQPAGSGYMTVFPCTGLPGVSNMNTAPFTFATANGAIVRLSPAGELCVYTVATSHIVVDVTGVFS